MTDPATSDDVFDGEPYDDPFEWFGVWFDRARELDIDYANAMTLATVSEEGQPRARTVLLKQWGDAGFVFYTNYESAKGRDIEATGRAAMQVHWRQLDRQFRLEGSVERIDEERSDAYFESRPRGSKIGAWASDQSEPIESRDALMEQFESYEEKFDGREVPRPPHWGGYRVLPERFVFWRAGDDRLHDRWEFEGGGDGGWVRRRLSP